MRMRNRVLAAVEALGYEPDLLAQGLRRGVTTTVGFLVGDISNPLFAEIAVAAEGVLREAGHALIMANSLGSSERDAEQLRLLRQRRVDGLIVAITDENDARSARELRVFDRPYVLVDRARVGRRRASAVLSDHHTAVVAAAEHLIELGHERIGFVGGSPSIRPTRERVDGIEAACNRHSGIMPLIRCGTYTVEHGEAATENLFSLRRPPTALIAGSNQILVGVLRQLRRRRLRIPQDVSLITCDDIPLNEFFKPALATISRDTAQIGRTAAELVLEAMRGLPARDVVLPVRYRAERSVGPPARKARP